MAESRVLLEFLLRTTLLWSRDLGFLVNWVKFFLHSTETSVLSWGSFRHPKVVGSAFRAQSFGSSGVFQDLSKGPLAPAPLLAEIFRPPCRLCGPCPLLQAADEASSASSSEGLHSLDRLSGLTCSLEFRFQGVVRGVGPLLLAFSKGKLFAALPPSLVITTDASGQGWGGGQFFTLTVCQGFGRRRRSLIISILWN